MAILRVVSATGTWLYMTVYSEDGIFRHSCLLGPHRHFLSRDPGGVPGNDDGGGSGGLSEVSAAREDEGLDIEEGAAGINGSWEELGGYPVGEGFGETDSGAGQVADGLVSMGLVPSGDSGEVPIGGSSVEAAQPARSRESKRVGAIPFVCDGMGMSAEDQDLDIPFR